MLVTASRIVGVPTKPVQEMAAVSGLLAALLVNDTVAVRLPTTVGTQFTVAEQVLPVETVPQLFEMVKSLGLVPLRVTADTTKLALPVLVAVIFWAPLVVVVWMLGGENESDAGLSDTAGAGAATPLVVMVTFCGVLAASSIKCRLAVRAPVPPGVIVMSTVHTEPMANVAPQLLVRA